MHGFREREMTMARSQTHTGSYPVGWGRRCRLRAGSDSLLGRASRGLVAGLPDMLGAVDSANGGRRTVGILLMLL